VCSSDLKEAIMAKEFKLPDLGEGIHEGEVIAVLVAVGDRVHEDQPILEIETDKARVEIPSPVSGMVKEISVKPGDIVKVGSALMAFDDVAESGAMAGVDTRPVETGRTAAESSKAPTAEAELPREDEPAGVVGQEGIQKREAKPGAQSVPGPVPASPATRRLARELGLQKDDRDAMRRWRMSMRMFFDAPNGVVMYMDSSLSQWSLVDMGIAAENLMLAAWHHGVGTCALAAAVAYPDVLRSLLNLPESKRMILGIAMGYPDLSKPAATFRSSREPMESLVAWHGFD
jgi:hypothetical protein